MQIMHAKNNIFILKCKMNYRFQAFMKNELNTVHRDWFRKEKFPKLNERIKANWYALDAIGIPIRQREEGTSSVFSWKRIGNQLYNSAVNKDLIGHVPTTALREQTIQALKVKHGSDFSVTKGVMRRLLLTVYPDMEI